MAFYQKYRPQKFSQVIGQDHIIKTLLAAIKSGRVSHAYLLTGPHGTGKTTTARLLAKAINCERIKPGVGEPCNQCSTCLDIMAGRALDIIEIDAASHTGVENIRDIIDRARLAPTSARKKVYIIDEVHMLSKGAFNALLKTLEEPPNHVVFILATTEVHKLPSTIISRTQRYDFRRVSKADIILNLKGIAKSESIEISEAALDLLSVAAAGGFRDSVVLLEQVSGYGNKINEEDVGNILGLSFGEETFNLLAAIFRADPEEGLKIIHQLYEDGADTSQFLREVIEILRRMLIYAMSGQIMFEETKERTKKITDLADQTSSEKIRNAITVFIENSKLLREVSNPVLPLEMAIVELTDGQKGEKQTRDERRETDEERQAKGKGQNDERTDLATSVKHWTLSVSNDQPINSQLSTPNPRPESKEEIGPAPVLEMTADLWQKVIVATKKENTSLAALLRDAKPISVTSERIVLGVKFKFHKDRISEIKNKQILERIWKDLTGMKCILSCELCDNKKTVSQPVSDDGLQKAVGEVFEISS
jgi:DNA polymerase-3 subunit gamma/tau